MSYAEAQAAELAMQSAIAAKPSSKPRSAPRARFAKDAARIDLERARQATSFAMQAKP